MQHKCPYCGHAHRPPTLTHLQRAQQHACLLSVTGHAFPTLYICFRCNATFPLDRRLTHNEHATLFPGTRDATHPEIRTIIDQIDANTPIYG